MPLYTLRGVDVQFPHEAYDCQLAYMEKVIQALQEGTNALLESPTGTGKTLCLLCATLAWRESLRAAAQAAAKPESSNAGEVGLHSTKTWAQSMKEGYAAVKAADPAFLPSIIYSSRTHSQLAQVMRELKGSGYKPKTCVLGSRQQMCLHPTVSALSGAAANQACRAVTTSRSCQWFNRLEGFVQSNPDANREPLDIEDLVRLGQVQGPCPFYLAREMANTAEILFMPYNYLIDTKTRIGLQMVKWENSVLIFDEAHNLEGVCAEASSFDLPAALLAACIQEVNSALEAALVRREGSATNNAQAGEGGEAGPPEKNYFQLANDLRNLKGLLQHLESAIAAIPVGPNGFTAPGPFLFELLAKIGLTGATCHPMIGLLEEAIDLLSDQAAEHGRRSGARNSSHKLNALADALRLAFSTAEPSIRGEPPACTSYRVHIHMKKSKGGVTTPTLSYWCFSPGVSMRLLSGLGIRSVLLTSGTLAPLDSFAQELQLPFTITLENPHVIEASQVWVGVVPLGPKGCALNSSYANRDSREYKEDLGYAICNFARMVPDGLLVFFPSYTVLRGCIECWRSSGLEAGSTIWERITRLKQAVIEPQESALFSQAAEDFKTKLKDPSSSGAVFFAVCRGKVSEGLDFSDRAGRAVVITGIPFAMKTDAKVRLKREVLDEARQLSGKKRRTPGQAIVPTLSGEQWYVQQASRAVNQAMGRVIRHRHDFGAIILADERFRGDSTQKQLSCWLRNHVTTFPNFGAASGSLTKFFRDKVGFHVPERVQAEKAPLPDNAAFASVGGGAGRGGASSSMLQLLSHLTVPAAVDTSGLASMELLADARLPGGLTAGPATGAARKSRLMTALQRGPPASAASALPAAGTASAHSGKPVDAKPAEKVTAASAKEWLAQIKAELSSSEYQQFHGMLKKYRAKEVDSMVLMDAVLGLLRAPGRSRLLMGFIPFLQKSDRGWFENAARRILESDSQQSQDPSQGKVVSADDGPSTSGRAGRTPSQLHSPGSGKGGSAVDAEYAGIVSNSSVKVAVVVRPLTDAEKKKTAKECIEVQPPSLVKLPAHNANAPAEGYQFEYDRVYKLSGRPDGTRLFMESVQPLLARYLQGFNATVFAYGQTGSGKSYTMGTAATVKQLTGSKEPDGIIPKAVKHTFESLKAVRGDYDVLLKVDYVEIYQDDIRDLLAGEGDLERQPSINVRESPSRGMYLEGVREVEVKSEADVGLLLERGNAHRAVAAHNLNEQSSRSHALFTISLEQRRKALAPGVARKYQYLRSKLHLVDLAGAERVNETGTVGQQFREGININKGLSALGNVISALSEGSGRKHIPYRDSKLTRILQDSLGGNSETLMIACASPASFNQDQTLSTLRYASRARSIQNRLKLNNKYSPVEEIAYLRKLLAERDAEIARLKAGR
ncbi:hypothetical protein WJX72_011819 [[Myrmecia] bisecta]|uniref:Regulator of telomere elongation helicase 1 homolog n=1 Tax=[Myrmecia] bisecta TaxID=41462 RepID=A0AAW1PQU0_9CHLO